MNRLFFCIFSALLLLPAVGQAYIPSPQYGAFELKLGPYKPAVDDNKRLNGATPYQDTFGDDAMFLTTLELDWQFWHPPGFSLGIGGSAGFMQAYAKAKIADDEGAATDESSADYTVLNVIPFALLAVIRIDVLADELHVPLVPFFKAGLNWYLWWVLGAGGNTASAEVVDDTTGDTKTINGKGGTLGWQLNTGLMFRLDELDRMSARTFDNEVGANHSYLFAELVWAWVDRFGKDEYLNLSTDTFAGATVLFGVCVEF